MNRLICIVRPALAYGSVWLSFAGLFALVLVWAKVAPGWVDAFAIALAYLAPAMLIGGPVAWLAPRLIARRLSLPALVLAHAGMAITFTALWHGLFLLFVQAMGENFAVLPTSGVLWGWQVAYGLVVYGVVAGIATAANSTRRLREREVAVARAEALRVRAEMQALRGQLDPHFLFNTLHSITALVRTDPPRAEEALIQFGALLRRVLEWKREGTDEIPLADEFAFVDGYLALEQLRLGDRLRVERALDDDALACCVPVLSIQPLIENAIRHAIAPHRAGGTLTLAAHVTGGVLTVRVADQGPGADPAAVARATGTGLAVIRQRLHLRHGDSASLAVDTAPGRGFAVTLSIPAVHEPVLNAVA